MLQLGVIYCSYFFLYKQPYATEQVIVNWPLLEICKLAFLQRCFPTKMSRSQTTFLTHCVFTHSLLYEQQVPRPPCDMRVRSRWDHHAVIVEGKSLLVALACLHSNKCGKSTVSEKNSLGTRVFLSFWLANNLKGKLLYRFLQMVNYLFLKQ